MDVALLARPISVSGGTELVLRCSCSLKAPLSVARQPRPEAEPILTTTTTTTTTATARDGSKPAMVGADRAKSGEETGIEPAMEPRLVSNTEARLVATVTTAHEAQAARVTSDDQSNPATVSDERRHSSHVAETCDRVDPQESMTADATGFLAARTTNAFTASGPSVSASRNRHERLTGFMTSHQHLVRA